MKYGAVKRAVLVVILGTFALSHSASAQTALGGPKKPTTVGGAAKQNSPVVPANKGGTNATSSPSRCAGGACAMKGHK
jgi:hypothetical protein